MIFVVVGALGLLGGTTFLALQQPVARDPLLNRRLTGMGIALCLITALAALGVTIVILP